MACVAGAKEDIKEPDLAGSWYPASSQELSSLIEKYLSDASPEKIDGKVFAIISPHAGYRFSGPVAAYGYKAVENSGIKTVVLIGFSHHLPFDGISVYDKGVFRTPLGDVAVDTKLASELEAYDKRLFFYPAAFSGENSVEMQIPFIQTALKGVSVVPIAFGGQSYEDAQLLADALAQALKGRSDYLIVASTDLSHYHTYEDANAIDKHFIDTLTSMKAQNLYDQARYGACELCGLMPVTATLLAADKLGYGKVKILKYANSGDTYGDKTRVVGYLSAAFYAPSQEPAKNSQAAGEGKDRMLLNKAQHQRLLEIARGSIVSFVRDGKRSVVTEKDPVLNQPMGAFVTLHKNGRLRGCIGNIIGRGPLCKTVADMAVEAATGDPRFPVLSPSEINEVDVEVSVLSPLKKISNIDEIQIPGHGVLVRQGFRSGVYLPQVATETGWNKEQFLTSLCADKAGLAPDAWKSPGTDIYVFSAEVFGEKEGHNEE